MLLFIKKYQSKRFFSYLLFFLLFNLTFVTFGFGQQHKVSGHVIDIITKLPIEDVNIIHKETGAGTTTNSAGFFSLNIDVKNLKLTCSHISYQTNIVDFQADKINTRIEIQLTPKSFELSEAIITAKRQFKFSVVDFNFIDSNLLILTTKHRNNSYKLFLLNTLYDTIARVEHLPTNRQGSIYKDCMGNCHLILKDSAYQVIVNKKMIELAYPVHTDYFFKIMQNCMCETEKYLVFKKPAPNPYLHTYFAAHKESHEVIEFISEMELEKMAALQDELRFINTHKSTYTTASFALAIAYAHKIAFKPSNSFLDKIGDSIYYFNHGASQLEVYSDLIEFTNSKEINYHHSDNWKSIIIVDKIATKAYTIFTRGSKYEIQELSLNTGKTTPKQIIPLAFPEKLKINNGYVYFLYKETGNIWARKELYRLKL